MIYEFEGKTEKEAIDKAAAELRLSRDSFDVEIVEAKKGGIFGHGTVKIRVHTDAPNGNMADDDADAPTMSEEDRLAEEAARKNLEAAMLGGAYDGSPVIPRHAPTPPEAQNDMERSIMEFTAGVVSRMGYQIEVLAKFREREKICFELVSPDSAALIGRKGKTLDALQLLVTIYAAARGWRDMKILLDSESYRERREDSLVKLARTMADRVRASRGSVLLEPMNPYDRRIIHTTLAAAGDIATESEGDSLYKQVRIYYKR